ncbi:hypothetical protein AB0B25_25190 [Nocardia sp. NPDC049190]|uniref:hypothetical protein n=1 Tax=Nocardia sp. NPDC049190 TaxID=3155650 RepID=UPI0033DD8AAC
MTPAASPRPEEPDVHLSIFLYGARFDFAACLTAALLFIQDHRARHHADAVDVFPSDTTELRRLPCERLFLDP